MPADRSRHATSSEDRARAAFGGGGRTIDRCRRAERGELGLRQYGWNDGTPLWPYILRESSLRLAGARLGEVTGRIVAEVLHGVIAAHPESYLALEPSWSATLPVRGEMFQLTDLLVH